MKAHCHGASTKLEVEERLRAGPMR